MKYTNKLNLPEAYVKAVTDNQRPPEENVYHVTELLKPISVILLERQHYNDIEIDVSECSNTLFGTCVHHLMEISDPTNAEQKIEFEVGGVKVSGRIDKIDTDGSIVDWKTCRASMKDFEDWRMQGLIYAYGRYIKENKRTPYIKFYGLCKDSSVIKGDPAIIPYLYKVNDSDIDFINDYLYKKIAAIKKGELIPCTDEERWKKPNVWKLYAKEDSPRALKVFDHCPTEDERMGKIVKFYEGENTRCLHFCRVRKWCPLYNKNTPTEQK